jgi:hypothetical protein
MNSIEQISDFDNYEPTKFDSKTCPTCWSGLLAFLGLPEDREAKEAAPCTQ